MFKPLRICFEFIEIHHPLNCVQLSLIDKIEHMQLPVNELLSSHLGPEDSV